MNIVAERTTVRERVFVGEQVPTDLLHSATTHYCEVWKEPPWLEDWNRQEVFDFLNTIKERPGNVMILAETGGRVVGISAGWSMSFDRLSELAKAAQWSRDLESARIFYVAELCTDPMIRGHGIGTRISSIMLQTARNTGHDRFALRTHVEAFPAHHVYAKLGFSQTGFFDAELPDREYWLL